MKSFRTIVSEVAHPKAGDEKAFKDKHITTKKDHPVADDNVFKGGTKKSPKRIADHDAGEDAAVYEGMDPVNKKAAMGKFKHRADKDIDNDGDVDSSDKYLHARRKAITKAIHKEEAELEESITKMSHGRLKFHMNNKSVPHGSYSWDQMKAERDRRLKTGEGEAYKKAKASMSEEVEQLDEIGDTSAGKKKLKNLIVNRTQKVADAGASLERRPEKAAEYDRAQKRHMKTIGRAATRLAKEEVEQLDELSPDLKSRYAKKSATSLKRATTYKAKAQDDAAKASKNIDRGYGGDRSVNINKQYNRLDRADAKVAKHDKTIAKRTTGLKRANEEVELDESWSNGVSSRTAHVHARKAREYMNKARVSASRAKMHPEGSSEHSKHMANYHSAMAKSIKSSYHAGDYGSASYAKKDHNVEMAKAKEYRSAMKEEVEQLDELSPNTLHSYIKKASGNMAGNAAVAATQASSSMKKSSPDVKRNIRNRMRGITSASGRLADKANMAENAWEEIPMMQRQLQFISYAAEEISDYLSMGVDPEEWFQNKLAGLHQTMLSMYAYAQGEMQMSGGMYGEEVELDEISMDKLQAYSLAAKQNRAGNDAVIMGRYPGSDKKAYADNVKRKRGLDMARKKIHNKLFKKEELDESQRSLDAHKFKQAAKVKAGIPLRRPGESLAAYVTRKAKAQAKMQKEEVELDEANKPTMQGSKGHLERLKSMLDKAKPGSTEHWQIMDAIESMFGSKHIPAKHKNVKPRWMEEVELDEATPTKKAITRALQGMKVQPKDKVSLKKAPWEKNEDLDEVTQSAIKKPVTTTGPDGKTRTVYRSIKSVDRDEHGQEKIKESVLDEAFKTGIVKLKDGGSVILKKEDADLLNQMFKDLSSANRKKMQEVAMKDKAGFEEILGFAKEAL